MKNKHVIALCILCLLFGSAIGFKLCKAKYYKTTMVSEIRDPAGYKWINPLLECNGSMDIIRESELGPFSDKIKDYVDSKIASGAVKNIAVYFRELNDGIWFSVGDIERFIPASLLKVPVMLSILKQSGSDPGLLEKKVVFEARHKSPMPQNILPSERLEVGHSYTVDELMKHMISYSDNDAFSLLNAEVINQEVLAGVYKDFGLDPDFGDHGEITLSAPGYAAFFRVLYNATYLSKELSERALEYLVESEFSGGIIAGVPGSVKVAHKFGERVLADENTIQIHDCGIVYYHRHPYLLCVMTRGRNIDNLTKVIADISAITYTSVDEANK